jgi:hypothetical protein
MRKFQVHAVVRVFFETICDDLNEKSRRGDYYAPRCSCRCDVFAIHESEREAYTTAEISSSPSPDTN